MKHLFHHAILASVVSWHTLSCVAAANQVDTINFESCQIKLMAVERDAECGILSRPENPQQPDGRKIELFVAKFPSTSPKPEADAFTMIQGGPGGSSVDMAISYYPLLQAILNNRDAIFIDQRGTGRSNKLACPEPEEQVQALSFDPIIAADQAKICIAAHQESDLAYYTTSLAVQDLDAVRAAAGYQQLTVYGVSYGTRVAQHYMRRFPDNTRAVILDGVVPIGLNLAGGEIARRSQDAFDGMVKRCNADSACVESFGDLTQKFKAVRERLKKQPIVFDMPHPSTSELTSQTISEQHLYAAIRMMPYGTEGLALLPLLISQAYDGNYSALAGQAISIEDSLSQGFAIGMQNSVMCAEDFPFTEAADKQGLDSTYFGNTMIEAFNVACNYWPKGYIDKDFRTPFDSDRPVLILSGETDPITPPNNGKATLEMLTNAKHIIVPAHGHGVLARGCVPALVTEFVDHADLSLVNSKCVERERAMPFFIDATGPRP